MVILRARHAKHLTFSPFTSVLFSSFVVGGSHYTSGIACSMNAKTPVFWNRAKTGVGLVHYLYGK